MTSEAELNALSTKALFIIRLGGGQILGYHNLTSARPLMFFAA
jgi:hypothetical protein